MSSAMAATAQLTSAEDLISPWKHVQSPRKPYGRMRTLVSDLRTHFDDPAIDAMVGLLAARPSVPDYSSTCMPVWTAAYLLYHDYASDPRLTLLFVGAAVFAAVACGPGRCAAVRQRQRRRGCGGAASATPGLPDNAVRGSSVCLIPSASVATTS